MVVAKSQLTEYTFCGKGIKGMSHDFFLMCSKTSSESFDRSEFPVKIVF